VRHQYTQWTAIVVTALIVVACIAFALVQR
jgi:hypothetical protein